MAKISGSVDNFIEFHFRDTKKTHPNYGVRIFIDIADICCVADDRTRDGEEPLVLGSKIYMRGHEPISILEIPEVVLQKIKDSK